MIYFCEECGTETPENNIILKPISQNYTKAVCTWCNLGIKPPYGPVSTNESGSDNRKGAQDKSSSDHSSGSGGGQKTSFPTLKEYFDSLK